MEIGVKYFDSSQGDDDVSKLNLRCWDMKRMCGMGKVWYSKIPRRKCLNKFWSLFCSHIFQQGSALILLDYKFCDLSKKLLMLWDLEGLIFRDFSNMPKIHMLKLKNFQPNSASYWDRSYQFMFGLCSRVCGRQERLRPSSKQLCQRQQDVKSGSESNMGVTSRIHCFIDSYPSQYS